MGVYQSLQDKYYGLMDKLDGAGLPVYKVIDALENKGIPTFPIFIIICILIIAGIIYGLMLLFGVAITPTGTLTVFVTDSDDNPLSDAKVSIVFEGGSFDKLTDSSGKADLSVPLNKSISITASKTGFGEKNETLSIDKTTSIRLALSQTALTEYKIKFFKSGTSELINKTLTVSFSCSNDAAYFKQQTTSNGSISIEVDSAKCGTLLVDAEDFECDSGCNFYFDSETGNVYLSDTTTERGTINVFAENSAGEAIAGILVKVISKDSYTETAGNCETRTSGGCTITSIPYGNYYLTAMDETGTYAFYDSSSKSEFIYLNSSNPNATATFSMETQTIGKIKLKIVDSASKQAIESATIKLNRNNQPEQTRSTGTDGLVEFNVNSIEKYSALIDKAGYNLKTVENLSRSDDTTTVELVKSTENNSATLQVEVVDEKQKPVENVKLNLKDGVSGKLLGKEIVTGMDGKAQFERLDEGKYIVFAEKTGFTGKDSIIMDLKIRQENIVKIQLTIGEGTVKAIVFDDEGKALQGATIIVMDSTVKEEISRELSGVNGEATIKIRADKKAYLKVSANGFEDYYSTTIQPAKDGTIEKQINLVKSISGIEAKLLGLYLNGEKTESTLASGQKYTAKILLMVPDGFDNAGLHLRTGNSSEGSSNAMEKDSLFIKDLKAANSRIVRGTTFTPNNGYSTDSQHLTSGNAKWVEAIIEKPKKGVYEIEAEIQVKDGIAVGALLDVWIRSFGVSGNSYTRNPGDATLGGSENSSSKQALYANATHEIFTTGPTSLCEENFCHTFSIRETESGLSNSIVDLFEADIERDYKLGFSITSISALGLGDSSIEIKSSSLKLGNYEIVDALAQKFSGTVSGKDLTVSIGSISDGSTIYGSIDFRTKKEGANKLEIGIASNTGLGKEKVFNKTINISVPASQGMTIETVPKIIVPFIQNNLLIKIQDSSGENALEDALVSVYVNDSLIDSIKTDSEGIIALSIEAPSPGAIIKIRAEKTGYKTIETELTAGTKIVAVSPEQIIESLNVKLENEIERDVQLNNLSEIPLTLVSVDASNDFKGLVSFEWSENLIGKQLFKGADENVLLTIKISPKGKEIIKPTKLNGKLSLVFENLEFDRQWLIEIPLKLTLGLEGTVDSTDCLSINPGEWKISTDKQVIVQQFVLVNNCSVDGEKISLKNLKAKRAFDLDNELGDFDLRTDLVNAQKIKLSETMQLISASIPADSETTVSISFTPFDIESGTGESTIILQALNPTTNGEETLETRLNVSVQINKLTECVKVNAPQQLMIELLPNNYGYGAYQQYYGYTPTTSPNSYLGTGNNPYVGYPQQLMNQNYPYSNYSYPFVDSTYQSSIASAQFGYGYVDKVQFEVQNNCESAVDIEISPDVSLTVSPTKVSLSAGESKKVDVKSNYFIGQYPVEVKAKVSGSKDKQTSIKELIVTVERTDTRIYSDCISISTRTFDFSDFIPTPQYATIKNTCYDLGIRLIDIKPFYSAGKGDYYSDLAQGIEVVDLRTVPSGGKTIEEMKFRIIRDISYRAEILTDKLPKQGQSMTLGQLTIYATQLYYKVKAPSRLDIEFITKTGMPETISYEITLQDLWALAGIEGIEPGTAGAGLENCINKDALDIVSAWQWMAPESQGFVDVSSLLGKNVDWTTFTFQTGGKINIAGKEYEQDTKELMIIDEEHCGTLDKISKVSPSKFTQSGVNVTLTLSPDGHDIKVFVDKTGITSSEVKIEKQIQLTLVGLKPVTSKTVNVPLRIWIKGKPSVAPTALPEPVKAEITKNPENTTQICKDAGLITPEELNACLAFAASVIQPCSEKGFETAEQAFNKYGFDKLLFNWNWKELSFNECDASNEEFKFCDSVQNAITLNKKSAKIKEFLQKISESTCLTDSTQAKIIDVCKDNSYKGSDNLFRFAKQQILLNDLSSGENLVFFLGEDGKILAGNPIDPALSGYSDFINSVLNGTYTPENQAKLIVDQTNDYLFEKIRINPANKYYQDMVGEIPLNAITPANSAGMAELGIDRIDNADYQGYVLTMGEYETLHKALKLAMDTPGACSSTTCKINYLNKSVELSLAAFKEITEGINFKVGIRNIVLDEKSKAIVLEKAKDKTNLIMPFKEFYDNYISFSSYLISDGLTNDFKRDFQEFFGSKTQLEGRELILKELDSHFSSWNKTTENDWWTFDGYASKPGRYTVFINFDWSKGKDNYKITVKTSKDKHLYELDEENKGKGTETTYQNNYFFYMPFDGEIGETTGGAKVERQGYGLSFSKGGWLSWWKGAQEINKIQVTYGDLFDEKITLHERDSGTAFKHFEKTRYLEEFKDVKDGKILEINGTEKSFSFSPSIPLTMILKLQGSTKGNGILYELKEGTGALSGLSSLITWQSAQSGTAVMIDNESHTVNELCSGRGSEKEYGFILDKKDETNLWATILYLAKTKDYSMQIMCAQEKASIQTIVLGEEWKTPIEITSANTRTLTLHKSQPEYETTLSQSLEAIKSGSVCFKSNAEGITLTWNPAQILGKGIEETNLK